VAMILLASIEKYNDQLGARSVFCVIV